MCRSLLTVTIPKKNTIVAFHSLVCLDSVSIILSVNMKCLLTKGAALVLVWTLCLSTALGCISLLQFSFCAAVEEDFLLLLVPPSLIVIPALPVSGWLADLQLGNFRVFRAGCVLLFLGSVLLCVCILVLRNLYSQMVKIATTVITLISHLLFFSGVSACAVTVLQLGLDQMPDASSTGITGYILKFFTMCSLGLWINDSLFYVLQLCYTYWLQSQSLLPVLWMCILLSLLFLFGKKWLIIEPKSPQSLKIIYRVLKFAAKHKAPLNRSALTYWEENVPSRLDLGKARFGGPFKTEQVEDVKTFFRLLLLFLPVGLTALSASIFGTFKLGTFLHLEHRYGNMSSQNCLDSVYISFTYKQWWCTFVTLCIRFVSILV